MKKKILEEIILNPARYYRVPADVLRDRRFCDEERAVILEAWRPVDKARAGEIDAVLGEIQNRSLATE